MADGPRLLSRKHPSNHPLLEPSDEARIAVLFQRRILGQANPYSGNPHSTHAAQYLGCFHFS